MNALLKGRRVRILRGSVWPELLIDALGEAVTDIRHWMNDNTRVLKSDEYSQVGLLNVDNNSCYLKYYQAKSRFQGLLFGLGHGRGVSSFDAATQLLGCGITVPTSRACLSVPGGMLLLTEGLPDAIDLKSLWQADITDTEKSAALQQAGKALAKLHGAGFAHGDMKWSNLLRLESGFSLVDLEGVTRAQLGSVGSYRDIARFTLNCEDMSVEPDLFQAFLSTYLSATGSSESGLYSGVPPILENLRRRHRKKYGERGRELLARK
ncbi:MAG: lipopolysaccharide kinase InaA family protein [Halioglobus sp.]